MLDTKYLKRVGISITATVLCAAMALYLGYHLWRSVTSDIETTPAVPDVYSFTEIYDAWVFRDEAVLASAGGAGQIVPSYRDGEYVSRNSAVAQIYSSVSDGSIAELETVRSQIRLLEGRYITGVGDLGIGDAMLSLAASMKNGILSDASKIASRLTALASVRLSSGTDTAAAISSLKEKEASILGSLGSSSGAVYTPVSGWYYKSVDGYESVFTPDAAEGISPEGLDALLESEPVQSQSAAGRIVRSYQWYIAVNMDSPDAAKFTEGSRTEVEIAGVADPLELTVESAVHSTDGRTAVVFSCGTIPDSFDIGRRLTLEFTLNEVEGFGIPKDAVRVRDGVTGVFVYNGVIANFRKVEILTEYNDLYIVAINENFPEETTTEATVITDENGAVVTESAETATETLPEGAGRREYLWLSTNEFIITKGKALDGGKLIG